ncbi:MAG TPA: 5'-3' exonuclease H3TH domain-containing protein [Baekduia sp.]|nr:5'-3' exonuclease H3TH domain-containing protein [Baekduia sp.]
MPGPLLAVDAPSLLYRAFFALPKSIKGADGRPVNALLGTANLLLQAVERHAPRAVILCFGAEAAAYRVELFAPYHDDREVMPHELVPQWADAPAFFAEFGWPSVSHETLEADDLLGSLALAETRAGGDTVIFSGDRDMFQCVGAHCSVLFPGGKDGPELIDVAGVIERYGIEPAQVPDFIALRGDPSDGLPGAKGIGAKGAAKLLQAHGDLEGVIAAADQQRPAIAAALTGQADQLRDFKHIATLQPVEVEVPPDAALDPERAAAAARARGINRLAERLLDANSG